MKKISIVPEIINSEEIIILDENKVPISICQKSMFKFNYSIFQMPFVIVDNFERRRYKDIEIRRIDLKYLEKVGFRLVSLNTSRKIRNYPRQAKSYLLEADEKPIPNSTILAKIPKDHYIEMDVVNSRVRLKGRNVYPYHRSENSTPWIPCLEKDGE